jgi:hypothetical protein
VLIKGLTIAEMGREKIYNYHLLLKVDFSMLLATASVKRIAELQKNAVEMLIDPPLRVLNMSAKNLLFTHGNIYIFVPPHPCCGESRTLASKKKA